jgi:hypothetical protein
LGINDRDSDAGSLFKTRQICTVYFITVPNPRHYTHILLSTLLLALAPACTTTITPSQVPAAQASYDGAEQNSGILHSDTDGYVITPGARARYNALIAGYGAQWTPAIEPDYGITPYPKGRYHITNEALVKFLVMNQWRKTAK